MTRREFGNVRQVSPRRWQARYTDRGGASRSRTFPTRQAAVQHLAEVRADLARGQWLDPSLGQRKFCDYATEWLAARVDLKATTHSAYAYTLRRHLIPSLGGYSLEELTSARIRSWY